MILTESNFTLFAAKYYENHNCESLEEFEKDIAIFKYLKKLFFVYENKSDLRERLILNHLIVLYNVFEAKACTKMLVMKMKEYHSFLFPFLLFLGYLPQDKITGIYNDQFVINVSDIPLNEEIIKKLREIKANVR
jgi:hypothetical protein